MYIIIWLIANIYGWEGQSFSGKIYLIYIFYILQLGSSHSPFPSAKTQESITPLVSVVMIFFVHHPISILKLYVLTNSYMQPLCKIKKHTCGLQVRIFFRKIALVVIFTRAGLDLDPVALKKLYCRVLFLALIPWCTEAAVIAVTVHYLLSLPWKFAILCG